MLLNTLLYNGFIGGATPISDRYTRLFLVSVYILLYLLQSLYSCYTLIGIYECLAQQASWRWIFQAGFFLMNPGEHILWLCDELVIGATEE
ncbi:hypothetical protein DL95DRAFT_393569 [Leptodontidium sp. 2 PMI_412]|nr:hypothetical protein DL95DRAFT_393569 [Leptodontidium sp. 2 PMI_412]